MDVFREDLRGGTRAEASQLSPCRNCGNEIGPGEAYFTSNYSGISEAWHATQLYFDECAQAVLNTIKGMGFCVAETMPTGTPDVEWLAKAGKNGWTVITQDLRIAKRQDELQALIDNKVKCFVLPEEPRNSWDLVRGFAAMWSKIEVEALYEGPFIWKYHDESHPVRWEQIYPTSPNNYPELDCSIVPLGHLLNMFADVVRWHDQGWYSWDFVQRIHESIRKELEARVEGLGSPQKDHIGELLVDGMLTGREQVLSLLNGPVPLGKFACLEVVMEREGLRYPWLLPARIQGRYTMGDRVNSLEAGLVIPDPNPLHFQRPYVGVLHSRNHPWKG